MAINNLNTELGGGEVVSAGEGVAFITLDGKNYPLFYVKSVEATITKNKQDVKVVGKRSVGKKTTSWEGSGTLSIYEVTSFYKQLFVDYVKNGVDRYFTIKITNEDKSTSYGRETKLLSGCNFDEINFAHLDGDDALLEQELPFTFEDVELLESFV